jgi:hypothetical protein
VGRVFRISGNFLAIRFAVGLCAPLRRQASRRLQDGRLPRATECSSASLRSPSGPLRGAQRTRENPSPLRFSPGGAASEQSSGESTPQRRVDRLRRRVAPRPGCSTEWGIKACRRCRGYPPERAVLPPLVGGSTQAGQ